ncbi:MAG: NTP transferase domain-containing protein, partial [Desulfonatronovibrionaceae bacterium]
AHNPLYQQGMFTSVQAAVKMLPSETRAFFILPVDIPLVRPWNFRRATALFEQHNPVAVRPCFEDQPGHPPLISFELAHEILNYQGRGGLGGLLQNHARKIIDFPTFDRNVLLDMDYPEDYARIRERSRALGRLDQEEALALVSRVMPMSQAGLAHGRAVADTARALAGALNKAGCSVDAHLAWVCGLVHDMAKGSPDHEKAGGRILEEMGLREMVQPVACHRDVILNQHQEVTVTEVVCLADKLTRGPARITVQDRFQEKLDLFHDDQEATAAISRRLRNALQVQQRIEHILGCPVSEIIPAL